MLFIGPESRECGKCHQVRPYPDFSPRGDGKYKSVCKPCCATQARSWYSANTVQSLTNRRRLQIMADYGITPERYDAMLVAQNGVCAVCGKPESTERGGKTMRLPVDHCHKTGRVRGLLCNRCNRAIGLLGESVDLLERAIDYLKKAGDYN